MATCEECGKPLTEKWLARTKKVELCRDCYTAQAICDDCGKTLPKKFTVTCGGLGGARKTLCRDCMLKDELPIEVILVKSSHSPWDEQEVVPLRDLLYELVRKPAGPTPIGDKEEPKCGS